MNWNQINPQNEIKSTQNKNEINQCKLILNQIESIFFSTNIE